MKRLRWPSLTLAVTVFLSALAATSVATAQVRPALASPVARLIFQTTPIPEVPQSFSPGKTLARTLQAVDEYFDQMIRPYSATVQAQLRAIYYQREHLTEVPRLIENEQQFAHWVLLWDNQGGVVPEVRVDSRIARCPLFLRLNLIHEVGVHIGQALARVERLGTPAFLAEYENQHFKHFTEISAAFAEKPLINGIPIEQFQEDLRGMRDSATETFTQNAYRDRRRLTCPGALRAAYRQFNTAFNPSELALFEARISASHPHCLAR